MNYTFRVNWIRPNGVTSDITDRTFLDQIGSLNRGIAAPDELQAFVSGDVALSLNNQDGFFTVDLRSDVTNAGTLQTYLSYIQVEIIRNGIRWFRGVLLPSSIVLDNLERVANVVALGPMRFIDNVSAELYQRSFVGNLQVAATAAEDSNLLALSSSSAPLLVGDTLGVGTDDVLQVEVVAWSPLAVPNPLVSLADPLTRTVAIGEPVVCLTPYYRNQNIVDLVPALFGLAGIVNLDVRFTGLVGTSSFTSNFNTAGADAFGSIRSMQRIISGGAERLMLLAQQASTGVHSRIYSSTVTSGFGLNASVVAALGSSYHSWADQGGLPGGGDPAGTDAQLFLKPYDWIKVQKGAGATYDTERHSYDIVRTVGGQTYLYELAFAQVVVDFNTPDYSGEPNYDVGGRGVSSVVKRYLTVDAGLNWTQDPAWVPASAAPTFVTYTGNAKTYAYKILGVTVTGQDCGVTAQGVTVTGPNNLGAGSSRVTVNWLAIPGATSYFIYRTIDGSVTQVFKTGIIGSTALLTFDDVGTIGGLQLSPNPNELRLYVVPSYLGVGGAAYDQGIQARPFITGAGYDHVLYVGAFSGSVGAWPFNIDRLQVNGNIAGARTVLHFEAQGCRAILTKRYSNYTNVNRRVDLYFWDFSSAAPGIVHESDDAVFLPTGGAAIYGIPGLLPQLRTLVWNQVEGVGSRVAMLFSSPQVDSGTGLLTMTPGTLFYAGAAEGLFSLEESIMLAPGKTLLFNTREAGFGAFVRNQVAHQNGYDAIVFGGDAPSNTVGFVTAWNVAIGNAGTVNVWVVYLPWGFWIVSRYHTGFIAYADFSELSVSKALQELAFVVNAFVTVDWTAGGLPFGSFVSRDLGSPNPVKVLANLDGSKPAFAVQDLIISAEYSRAWEQTFPYITITGQNDLIGTAGVNNARQQTADLPARFADTQSFADVVAQSLLEFYGPAWPPMAVPVVVPQGATNGGQVYGYTVVANSNVDPRVGILAYSGETRITNGALVLSGVNFNQLSFSAVAGATRYHVFRSFSSSATPPSSLTGYLGSSVITTFSDIGLAPNPAFPLPSRLKQPRQSARISVMDDGTNYRPADEVQFPDLLGHTQTGDPTKPPIWKIESIDTNPVEPEIYLLVVEKDVPS